MTKKKTREDREKTMKQKQQSEEMHYEECDADDDSEWWVSSLSLTKPCILLVCLMLKATCVCKCRCLTSSLFPFLRVEYTDAFGRTRECRRAELSEKLEEDKQLSQDLNPSVSGPMLSRHPTLYSYIGWIPHACAAFSFHDHNLLLLSVFIKL